MTDVFLYLSICTKLHWRKIAFSANPYIALIIALLFAIQPDQLSIHPYNIKDITNVTTNYNLVILGFSITAIALVIAIPSPEFLQFIANEKVKGNSPYRDLIFVISWTSFLHLMSFMLSIFFIFYLGGEFVFVFDGSITALYITSWIYLFFQTYSILQLVNVVIATFFLADLYAQHLAQKNSSYGRKWCLASGSSGDQIDVSYLDTIFEFYSGYHFGQVIEAA